MKKVVSFILCLVLTLGMSSIVFAETNEFVVSYSNQPSYEIVIPPSGFINPKTGKGLATISITDVNLPETSFIRIIANSENFDFDAFEEAWYLVNVKDNTDRLAYKIGTEEGIWDVYASEVMYEGSTVEDISLYLELLEEPKFGDFTDTITFTSEIINIINFTIEGDSYEAEEGMTWEEWVNSGYNTINAHIENSTYVYYDGLIAENNISDMININDKIITNWNYVSVIPSGGGSND